MAESTTCSESTNSGSSDIDIEAIREMFLDPQSDGSEGLLSMIASLHGSVREQTDLTKGTIPMERFNYAETLAGEELPKEMRTQEEMSVLLGELFEGAVRWHAPETMYNVTPPPLLLGVAASCVASLYNPNIAWDIAAGKIALAEQKVIAQLAGWVGWSIETSGGAFTFGGKATNLYGIKTGLRSYQASSSASGLQGRSIVVSTKACHPCHISCCDWLGIGTENCVRVDTEPNGSVNLESLESAVRDALTDGLPVVAIMVSGGTTMDLVVDPIDQIVDMRDRLVGEYGLDYVPHVHVDSVVGWPWLFFRGYDFYANPIGLSAEVSSRIQRIFGNLKALGRADSFGLDFHKTGFCSYQSSLFMVRDKRSYFGEADNLVNYGDLTAFKYTIENSRGGQSAIAAYTALNLLGVRGFQKLFAHLMEMAVDLQEEIESSEKFEVVNREGQGLAVIFYPRAATSCGSPDDELSREILVALRKEGNPFFIDIIPSYSTGSVLVDHPALKAYVMSPFSNRQTNRQFVTKLEELVTGIRSGSCRPSQDRPPMAHPLRS